MIDEEYWYIVKRICLVVALVLIVWVVLFLTRRKDLSCVEDQCRQLKAMIFDNLATVLG